MTSVKALETAMPRPGPVNPSPRPAAGAVLLLVATRKGAWLLHGDAARRRWRLDGPHFHGHSISHLVLDPRDGRTLLAAAKTGHLGPTIFRSTDLGRTWKEASRPPAFAQPTDGSPARSVDHTFWLAPCHTNQPGSWYAGTSPQGLFRSDDGGDTWQPLPGVNDNMTLREWMGTVQDGTPDGPKLHSIVIDPADPAHLLFGMSGGGVHESFDRGATWQTLIGGLEVVEGFDFTQPTFHDPHCIRACPSRSTRLYMQNHCGIYRLDRPSQVWQRIGRKMPRKVGDIGFPMVVHPRDADTAWVFPMDGSDVWPRTSPDGRPAAYVTRNAGRSWQRLDAGLPAEQAWWTVKRQALCADQRNPVGLYLGHTGGEIWMLRDDGGATPPQSWRNIARHLPEIYALETAIPAAD
jgi:hypothetical protein